MEHRTVEGNSVISQSTVIRLSWFLKHWKANSKDYNFHVLSKSQFVHYHRELCRWSCWKNRARRILTRIRVTGNAARNASWARVLQRVFSYFEQQFAEQLALFSHNFPANFQLSSPAGDASRNPRECKLSFLRQFYPLKSCLYICIIQERKKRSFGGFVQEFLV